MSAFHCLRVLTVTDLAALLTACATYHPVKSPQTGNAYYTEDLDRHGDSVRFADANTSARVSLPSSEVLEINEEDFKAHTPKE